MSQDGKITASAAQQKEDLERANTHGTYLDAFEGSHISEEHRQYLVQKHGTYELDPLPTMSDHDPYNWSSWKKYMNLFLIAIHACMGAFAASAIIPAYEDIAVDLGVTISTVAYLTSIQIVVLGAAPLLWRPLSTRYGRKPIFVISLIGSLAFNIGCAESKSYAAMATCRAFSAFFISPPGSLGSAVVVEMFFKKERAKCMGIWTVMVTVGIPLAPFIMGFVAYNVGYRWIYWIIAIIHGVQLILYLLVGAETRFIRHKDGPLASSSSDNNNKKKWLPHRIDSTPLSAVEFVSPLRFFKYPCVLIPACGHAMVFLFASVMCTVEIPQLIGQKFKLNAEQTGLQFIGIIIGSLIGEQVGGFLSDHWMSWRAKDTTQSRRAPEFRLWLSYSGILLAICGLVVFLLQTQNATAGHWNVTPIIGVSIAAVGNQIVTTIMITYAVDCYPDDAGSVGVFIIFVRQTWGFIGPFWFPYMFENIGIANSAAVASALMAGCALIPVAFLQWKGHKLRSKTVAMI
ncbi:MFS general substrate transporter [Dothidotthia symphoricarpi CBS 119687]|uniref:MFS general substrate transporter n=1 Tax=Dothidotthia symphoricarpi CBS 119687 TaxID=1392245 RepID=A0A6A6A2U6_9PLEO|nr:MFS general substrate transporter [Dothidotthia symphoricarpi CBS 119687]KAF2126130.1 MFS general substrate transporter [Dothidotthia symphoricarpi CBS 119687]